MNLDFLLQDLLAYIFSFLHESDVLRRIMRVNKNFNNTVYTHFIFRHKVFNVNTINYYDNMTRFLRIKNLNILSCLHLREIFELCSSITVVRLLDNINYIPILSETVTSLTCYSKITHIYYPLPPFLQTLIFRRGLTKTLSKDYFPSSLTYLELGGEFDQPLEPGILPSSLTYLEFPGNFDYPLLPGVLPPSLLTLKLYGLFNHPLYPNVLPPTLTCLKLSYFYNHPINDETLPTSLKKLVLPFAKKNSQVSLLPIRKEIKIMYE